MPKPDDDTVDIVPPARFAEKFFDASTPPFRLEFGGATHAGLTRPANEDHFALVRRRRTSELILTDLRADDLTLADDTAFVMAVADGMGGSRFGEFASRLAMQTMFELARQATSWVMKVTEPEAQQFRERVDAYVERIQATLRDYINADPALAGMGTTWTSAYLAPPHVLIVHIGDSRAYVAQDGQLRQITRDETLAQAFIDSGMDPETVSRFGHVLLNNLGGDTDDVTAQIHHLRLTAGDKLLLCTDGLTDMASEDRIASILEHNSEPQEACDKLIAAALDGGGKDNVTVALAHAV